MKPKVYIASPFFSPKQLEIVERIENHLSKQGIHYFSPRAEGVLDEMCPDEKMSQRKRIYEGNLNAMDSCTHMVAVLGDRDTGTIFEVGYFAKSSKPCVQYYEDLSKVSVMLSEGAFAITSSISKICDALDGYHNEYDQIGDTQ